MEMQHREEELHAVWLSLEAFVKQMAFGEAADFGRFYKAHKKAADEESIFDRQTVAAFWGRAELALQNGRWQALVDMGIPNIVHTTDTAEGDFKYISIPPHEIRSLDGGRYAWRRFQTQADNVEEA